MEDGDEKKPKVKEDEKKKRKEKKKHFNWWPIVRHDLTSVHPILNNGEHQTLALAYSCYSCSSKIVAKKSKTPQTPSPKGSDPPPPRITSNVKHNLRFLRSWKDFQNRKSKTPRPSTSYRRKRTEKDEIPEDVELYHDPTLTLSYPNQSMETATPVFLVDGYNVCGYWAKLKKHFMNGRLDIARQKLVNELISFSMLRAYWVMRFALLDSLSFNDILLFLFVPDCWFCSPVGPSTLEEVNKTWINNVLISDQNTPVPSTYGDVKVVVVFDAMKSGLPTHKENFFGIDIVYSSETCADGWIEKEVVALKEDGCPEVWVVTSDHSQQDAVYGSGAFVWSSKALVSEIKASQKEAEQMEREDRSTSMGGKLLKHNLDPKVVDALRDLRDKLSRKP
ncbi:hypothetical protein STAS_15475 [Striga asiatica]|uniref:YacP-like NYN domain protein n=1 Tax=Striga asiatica TaxID=4170 RepID=A0A5A7Q1C3_STRAF|nr:hypothetical protein STAS_15475 [Striga asiatica]